MTANKQKGGKYQSRCEHAKSVKRTKGIKTVKRISKRGEHMLGLDSKLEAQVAGPTSTFVSSTQRVYISIQNVRIIKAANIMRASGMLKNRFTEKIKDISWSAFLKRNKNCIMDCRTKVKLEVNFAFYFRTESITSGNKRGK